MRLRIFVIFSHSSHRVQGMRRRRTLSHFWVVIRSLFIIVVRMWTVERWWWRDDVKCDPIKFTQRFDSQLSLRAVRQRNTTHSAQRAFVFELNNAIQGIAQCPLSKQNSWRNWFKCLNELAFAAAYEFRAVTVSLSMSTIQCKLVVVGTQLWATPALEHM